MLKLCVGTFARFISLHIIKKSLWNLIKDAQEQLGRKFPEPLLAYVLDESKHTRERKKKVHLSIDKVHHVVKVSWCYKKEVHSSFCTNVIFRVSRFL